MYWQGFYHSGNIDELCDAKNLGWASDESHLRLWEELWLKNQSFLLSGTKCSIVWFYPATSCFRKPFAAFVFSMILFFFSSSFPIFLQFQFRKFWGLVHDCPSCHFNYYSIHVFLFLGQYSNLNSELGMILPDRALSDRRRTVVDNCCISVLCNAFFRHFKDFLIGHVIFPRKFRQSSLEPPFHRLLTKFALSSIFSDTLTGGSSSAPPATRSSLLSQ